MNDEFHPNAIVLEYLADCGPLNCVNYSKERHFKAMKALAQVHGALVVHNDIHSRNILIVPGCPEKVVLIDFDIAQTFPTKELLDQGIGIYCPEPVQSCEWEMGMDTRGLWKIIGLYPSPSQAFIAVSDKVNRSRIKKRDFHPIRSSTECIHPASAHFCFWVLTL